MSKRLNQSKCQVPIGRDYRRGDQLGRDLRCFISGLLLTFFVAMLLFAFAVEGANGWVVGDLSFLSAVVVPAGATGLVGALVGVWVGRKMRQGSESGRAYLAGAAAFAILSLASAFIVSGAGSVASAVVCLPGILVSRIAVEPLLRAASEPSSSLALSKEPVVSWVRITVSWVLWGVLGVGWQRIRN
ncbi:MAG: hypothetical protein ACE5E0_05250 [Terriglobia bacterium]